MEPPSEQLVSLAEPGQDPAASELTLGAAGLLLVAVGSLLAVPGVFFGMLTSGAGFLGPIVAGPLIEETLKPMGLIILLTRSPGLRMSATTGVLSGALAGLVFSAIENLIYLVVYFPEHTETLVMWRWTVCVCVHVFCSALVGYGLARSSMAGAGTKASEYRLLATASRHLLDEPRERSGVFQGISLKYLVIATLLHGTYNATAILLELGQPTIGQ